jgi:uncharacterized protein YlxP (DUF503 family)
VKPKIPSTPAIVASTLSQASQDGNARTTGRRSPSRAHAGGREERHHVEAVTDSASDASPPGTFDSSHTAMSTRTAKTTPSPGTKRVITANIGEILFGRSVLVKNVDVTAGYIGILTVELHFPEAGSLKGKRKFVKSAKAQLQNRLGAAVAEVDHHDLWQRSRLTIACVAREHNEAAQLLEEAVRYLNGQEYELVRAERDVVTLEE